MPIITLTTDFGRRDHYVACMKGVISQIAPKATMIDVTHEIEPGNVMQGAFVLRQTVGWFPAGTVHLAVVDPGVGTARRVIVAQYDEQYVVAPDNGLISMVHHHLAVREVRVVENGNLILPSVSATFHGRDVMAPVAAHLASGAKMRDIGPMADQVEVLQIDRPQVLADRTVQGQILYTDAFGNLITNISRDDVGLVYRQHPQAEVYVGEVSVGRLCGTYADVPPGQPLAVVGGTDMLEISVNRGSAQDHFQPAPDTIVTVKPA